MAAVLGVEKEIPGRSIGPFAPALALLASSVLINYIDRANLSVAAPLLKGELHISGSQLGLLFAAFFWTYTGLQFVIGWLVDRYDANTILAAGFLLWSLATIATGFVAGFATLLFVRLVLGIGESVAFPSYSKILARNLPEYHRGLANAVIGAGLKCGPAFGTLGAGLLIAHYGWRPVFIIIGVLSLAWLPAWRKWRPRGAPISRPSPSKCIPVRTILHNRSFWGATGGHFCSNYFLYFVLMWLPFYLTSERHLSMAAMAKVAGLYYTLDAVSAVFAGWQSDRLIRGGASPTVVRKAVMLIGHTTAALGLVGCGLAGPNLYMAYLGLAAIGSGFANPGIFAFPQTLAGPESAGRWVGLQNGFANFAGLISPALAGVLLDVNGNLAPAFMITSAVMLLGGFAWTFAVGRVEPVLSVAALSEATTGAA